MLCCLEFFREFINSSILLSITVNHVNEIMEMEDIFLKQELISPCQCEREAGVHSALDKVKAKEGPTDRGLLEAQQPENHRALV